MAAWREATCPIALPACNTMGGIAAMRRNEKKAGLEARP